MIEVHAEGGDPEPEFVNEVLAGKEVLCTAVDENGEWVADAAVDSCDIEPNDGDPYIKVNFGKLTVSKFIESIEWKSPDADGLWVTGKRVAPGTEVEFRQPFILETPDDEG